MLVFKEYFVNTVLADPTMQGYLPTQGQSGKYNVFPQDVDIDPEQFPCLIYSDAGGTILSRPQGMRVGDFQVDIISINSALEVENIYVRLSQLFNFKDSTTQTFTGTLWWIRENMVRDTPDSQRRIWRKMVNYKYWANNTDNT